MDPGAKQVDVVFTSEAQRLHLIFSRPQLLTALPQLQPPHRERNVVFTKSLSLYLVNKDWEIRCWGENLLARRDRESSQLPSFLHRCPRQREFLFSTIPNQKRTTKLKVPPYDFLCVSLPIFLTHSYSL